MNRAAFQTHDAVVNICLVLVVLKDNYCFVVLSVDTEDLVLKFKN